MGGNEKLNCRRRAVSIYWSFAKFSRKRRNFGTSLSPELSHTSLNDFNRPRHTAFCPDFFAKLGGSVS
jgi:hypothetical protein